MKKAFYILGSIEVLIGLLLLSATSILKEVFPLLGRVAFQAAAAGSYSPTDYQASFGLATVVAVVLLAAGVFQLLLAFWKKADK